MLSTPSLGRAGSACGLARVWALVALGFAPGCSFLFTSGPPAGHERMRYFACSTNRAAPVIDVGLSAASAFLAAAALVYQRGSEEAPLIVTSLAFSALEGVSAVHGFSASAQCDAAKRAWADREFSRSADTCGRDLDCRGDRVCEAGLCVAPRPAAGPLSSPPQPAPTPALP